MGSLFRSISWRPIRYRARQSADGRREALARATMSSRARLDFLLQVGSHGMVQACILPRTCVLQGLAVATMIVHRVVGNNHRCICWNIALALLSDINKSTDNGKDASI